MNSSKLNTNGRVIDFVFGGHDMAVVLAEQPADILSYSSSIGAPLVLSLQTIYGLFVSRLPSVVMVESQVVFIRLEGDHHDIVCRVVIAVAHYLAFLHHISTESALFDTVLNEVTESLYARLLIWSVTGRSEGEISVPPGHHVGGVK